MTETKKENKIRIEPFKLEPGQKFAFGHEQATNRATVGGTSIWIQPFTDPETGVFDLGITQEEREALEKKLGYAKDKLAPDSIFWRDPDNPFTIKIGDNGVELNLNNPKHYLQYLVIKTSDEVAPSLADRYSDGGRYQRARYYISDTEAEAKVKNKKYELEDQVISEYLKLDENQKLIYSRVLGFLTNSKASPEIVKQNFREWLAVSDGNKRQFLDLNSRRKDHVTVHSEILEAIEKRFLTKSKGGSIYTVSNGQQGELIAADINEAIRFYLEPKNSGMREELRNALKPKAQA